MTDLTEQLNKGELPEGDYYLDIGSDTIIDYWVCNHWNWTEYDSRIKAVLCEVPSYEEWQAKLNENAQLESEYEKECHRADELEDSYWKSEKENQKLKELLKECRSAYLNAEKNYGYDDSIIEICSPMIDKIDEALK